jgi:hypothetical protein
MKKITISISTVNDAFYPTVEEETIRIIRKLADNIELNGINDGPLMDLNGNKVGEVETY